MEGDKSIAIPSKQIGNYVLTTHFLGRGQFGEVVLAHPQKSDRQKVLMACKIIKKSRLTKKMQQNLRNEIGILSRIESTNVIQLYDIQKTPNNFYLFMQFCNGGDLEHLLRERERFSEQEARFILSQILAGFRALSKMKVMHRDLKLANILVHFRNADERMALHEPAKFKEFKKTTELVGNVDIVIADLGFAKKIGEHELAQTKCGTPLTMAPEVLQGARYNHKADVWSLGTIFYEMLTGFPPFMGRDQRDLQDNLKKGFYNFPKHIKLSLEGFDFLNCCLQYDPQNRMAWDELLRHGYANEKEASPENDGLYLSYNPDSGNYQALVQDRPQFNMNEHNATLINTRNPQYFE